LIDEINNDDGWLQGEFKIKPYPTVADVKRNGSICPVDKFSLTSSATSVDIDIAHHQCLSCHSDPHKMKPVLWVVIKPKLGPVVSVATSDAILFIIYELKVNVKPLGSAGSLSVTKSYNHVRVVIHDNSDCDVPLGSNPNNCSGRRNWCGISTFAAVCGVL